jgi:hypothetical protein
MSLLERLKTMLGFGSKPTPNYIGPDVSRAIQRNEAASDNARRALEQLRMSDTLRDITGKMK